MSCIHGMTKDNKCDKCGADLTKENSITICAFLDGDGFGEQHCKCNNCGNAILIRTTWTKGRIV